METNRQVQMGSAYGDGAYLDLPISLIAIPLNLVVKFLKTGHIKEPQAVREVWAAHGKHDTYLTLAQLQNICREILPGARVKRHLFWRYSLIWKKVPGS